MSQTEQPQSVESSSRGQESLELVKPLFGVHDSVIFVCGAAIISAPYMDEGVASTCLNLAGIVACVALAIGGRTYNTVQLAPFFCCMATIIFSVYDRDLLLFAAGIAGSAAAHIIATRRIGATLRQHEEAGKLDHEYPPMSTNRHE